MSAREMVRGAQPIAAPLDYSSVCFVDTETTGLNPDVHRVWEVALSVDGQSSSWLISLSPEEIAAADPRALEVGAFRERYLSPGPRGRERMRWKPAEIARKILDLTWDRHLVGANPAFDANFLRRLLEREGMEPHWSYHLVDVEAMAAAVLYQQPPWRSDDLFRRLGVEPGEFERHTALGDTRLVKAVYEAIYQAEGQ